MLGLYFLPRTIDEIRGEMPGGTAGAYFVDSPIGITAYVLEKNGVAAADLRAVVAEANDENDVATWLATHAEMDDANLIT